MVLDYLRHNDLDEHLVKIRELYRTQARAMTDAMAEFFPAEVSFTKPEGGMFLWATLPEGVSTMELFPKALERNVAFVPGDPFYPEPGARSTMRLNFTNADEETIRDGIQRLGEVIAAALSTVSKGTRTCSVFHIFAVGGGLGRPFVMQAKNMLARLIEPAPGRRLEGRPRSAPTVGCAIGGYGGGTRALSARLIASRADRDGSHSAQQAANGPREPEVRRLVLGHEQHDQAGNGRDDHDAGAQAAGKLILAALAFDTGAGTLISSSVASGTPSSAQICSSVYIARRAAASEFTMTLPSSLSAIACSRASL